MSIASRISAMQEHLRDDYDVLNLAGADLTNVNKNILNLKSTWQERLLYFMNNGTDVVWNNWDKVIGEGTTLTLNNTLEGKMKIDLKGNTSQEGTPTPETPQDIHVVSGENTIIVSNSDNTQSQSYPISLGDIELCKIGDYQDKIDKSTGKNLFNETYYNNVSLYTKKINYYAYIEMPDSFKTKFYGNMSLKGTEQDLLFGFSTTNNGVSQRMLNAGIIRSNVEYDFTNATNVYLIIGNGFGITLATDIPRIFENYNIMVSTTSNEPYEPYGTEWYLKKEIGSKLLTTSDYNNILSSYSNLDYVAIFKPNESANKGNSNNIPIIYTKGIYAYITNFNSLDNLNKITSSGGYNYFYLGVTKGITAEQAQNIVNGSLLYYPLATPTYTEITDSTLLSQLNALAKSYEGQTNISQESNDLASILNATALEEM